MSEMFNIKKIGLIINRKHFDKCKKLNAFIEQISKNFKSSEIELKLTDYKAHAIELAQKMASECDFLLAVGGDGTINEVITGLMLSGKNIFFSIFPCGSSNDLYKALKDLFDFSPENFRKIEIKEIDVAQINFFSENNKEQKRFFINIAEIGIGAITVKKTKNPKKFFSSKITYIVNSITSMLKYNTQKISIQLFDGVKKENLQLNITELVVANAKYFGNGINISPLSELNDGFLDLVMIEEIPMLKFIKSLAEARQGKLLKDKGAIYKKIKEIQINPRGNSLYPIEADGELLGFLPAEINIKENAIKFLNFSL